MKSNVEVQDLLKTFKTEDFFNDFESYINSIDLDKIGKKITPKTNFFPYLILKLWKSDLKPHYISKLKRDSVWRDLFEKT